MIFFNATLSLKGPTYIYPMCKKNLFKKADIYRYKCNLYFNPGEGDVLTVSNDPDMSMCDRNTYD